jgi:hypothetical protein
MFSNYNDFSMSDTFLRIIPTDPVFVPTFEAGEMARLKLIELLPAADEVEKIQFAEIQFVDQGGNFERLLCPYCKADLTQHMSKWFDAASQSRFTARKVSLPCCANSADLNDLDWQWPAGFATFMLEAKNPHLPGWLPEGAKKNLEAVLGCRLREIYAHY